MQAAANLQKKSTVANWNSANKPALIAALNAAADYTAQAGSAVALTDEKELVKVGIPYMDEMAKRLSDAGPAPQHPRTVLLAPSWGSSAIFSVYGGKILDVAVEHELYGQICVDLFIETESDAADFYAKLASCRDNPLKVLTDDCHYHPVWAPSEKLLDLIEEDLRKKGYMNI